MQTINNSTCKHPSNKLRQSQNTNAFCTQCGIILQHQSDFNNKKKLFPLSKPSKFNHPTELDPLINLTQMQFYLQQHPQCLPSKWYLNHRNQGISYIKTLCTTYHCSDKTFFSALSYLDILFSSHAISDLSNKAYDLKTISCFLLAAKFSENDSYPIDLNQFSSYEGNYIYSIEEIRKEEMKTLKELNYNLNDITAYEFVMSVINCGIMLEDEVESDEMIANVYTFCLKILTRIVMSEVFVRFNAFQIAFALVYLTRRNYRMRKHNMNVINRIYDVFSWEYLQCVEYIIDLFNPCKAEEEKDDDDLKGEENIKDEMCNERRSSMSTQWDSRKSLPTVNDNYTYSVDEDNEDVKDKLIPSKPSSKKNSFKVTCSKFYNVSNNTMKTKKNVSHTALPFIKSEYHN